MFSVKKDYDLRIPKMLIFMYPLCSNTESTSPGLWQSESHCTVPYVGLGPKESCVPSVLHLILGWIGNDVYSSDIINSGSAGDRTTTAW